MKNSIFWKLVLILLPFVILVDLFILIMTYMMMYESYLSVTRDDVKLAALTAADVSELFDPYNISDTSLLCKTLDQMCESFSLAYLYILIPSPEDDIGTYVAIGFGKDATDSAKQSHVPGYTFEGLSDEIIEAYTENRIVYRNVDNEYGNVIVCYAPVNNHWDSESWEFVDGETVAIVGAEMSIDNIVSSFQNRYRVILMAVFSSTILIVFLTAFLIKRFVSKPARLISRRMLDFVSDRKKSFSPIVFKGKDEFADMANSFNSMATEIDRYIEDISELNRQKSMQETEMNIARKIQMGLLEPTRFIGDSAEISAQMIPAKDVGGDFYNYQVLQDGRICIMIADVSGKGISSALYMSRAITLLRHNAEAGLSPSEMLNNYNNHLADHNPNTMFITTFVGIFDPGSFEFVYSNAGHNYPYLLSDELIVLDGARDMAAGIFKDEKYDEIIVKLKPCDKLFLYTDGVTEAKNSENKLFGDDRLKKLLQDNLNQTDSAVMDTVLKAVNEFSDGEPQSDDITVLCLMVPEKRRIHLTLPAKKESIIIVNQKLDALPVNQNEKFQLRLIAEEIFVNICSYAYEDGEGEAELEILSDEKTVTMIFTDSGREFDPTKDVIDIEDYDNENAIGGLGRFLSFNIADDFSYEYKDGKNILTIVKNIGNEV